MDVSKATFADEAIRECGTHACGRLRRLHRGEEGDKKRVVCVCDPAETADKDSLVPWLSSCPQGRQAKRTKVNRAVTSNTCPSTHPALLQTSLARCGCGYSSLCVSMQLFPPPPTPLRGGGGVCVCVCVCGGWGGGRT